jgi:hypothetical protein
MDFHASVPSEILRSTFYRGRNGARNCLEMTMRKQPTVRPKLLRCSASPADMCSILFAMVSWKVSKKRKVEPGNSSSGLSMPFGIAVQLPRGRQRPLGGP